MGFTAHSPPASKGIKEIGRTEMRRKAQGSEQREGRREGVEEEEETVYYK